MKQKHDWKATSGQLATPPGGCYELVAVGGGTGGLVSASLFK